jgi:FG-GAP repeat
VNYLGSPCCLLEVTAKGCAATRPARLSRSVFAACLLACLIDISLGANTLLDPNPEHSSTRFGTSIALIGDVNSDGIPDIAIGAPFQDGDFAGAPGFGPPQNVGKVWVFSGSTLQALYELNDPEFQKTQSEKFGGQFGSSVAAVQDIDGDTVGEIIVGVPHCIVSGQEKIINAGRAFVFSGRTGQLLLTLDDPLPQEGGRLGTAVAGLTDVNSDAIPDLLVGAPGKDVAGMDDSQIGVAYVFSGKDGSVIRSLSYPSPGSSDAGASFGAAVAYVGKSAVVIGAPERGRVFVFNPATGQLRLEIASPVLEEKASFGSAVAAGKDLDGDGIADFVVSAPLFNELRGAAFIFSGADGKLQHTLRSPVPQAFARFGAALFLADDIIGNGTPDILVGAPDQNVGGRRNAGQVFVFKPGGGFFSSITSATPQAFAGFGSTLAAGDFDHDGVSKPVIGAPFENANVISADGDIETHLQIGKIEIFK